MPAIGRATESEMASEAGVFERRPAIENARGLGGHLQVLRRATTVCTRRSPDGLQPNRRSHPPGHQPPVRTAVAAGREDVHGRAVAVEHGCSGLSPVLVGTLPSRSNPFVVIGNASVEFTPKGLRSRPPGRVRLIVCAMAGSPGFRAGALHFRREAWPWMAHSDYLDTLCHRSHSRLTWAESPRPGHAC